MNQIARAIQPYPEYRDSGVPWFGAIPAHWEVKRLGALLQERGENNADGKMEQVLSVMRDVGVIRYEDKGNVGNKKSEDITRYKIVQPDDIVVNSMNVIIGSVGLSRYAGCLSPVYYVLKPRSSSNNASYFNSIFQLKPFQKSLVRLGNGILAHRMRIPMELLKCELIPRPPPAEQAAIVRFLEHIDRRVNRFVRAKRRLVALLNEQKQAIIHRAVTRGLDPDVRLKPSGVEWLAHYPADWTGLPLKRWVSTKITDGPHETPNFVDEGVDFLSAESMVKGHFDFNRRRGFISRELHEMYCRKCRPQVDDIFMCKSGATTGKIAIVKTIQEFSIWSPLALIRTDLSRVKPMFLYHVLQSGYVQQQVRRTWSAGTQPNLSMAAMERLFIVLPEIQEQHSLLERIEEEIKPITESVSRIEHEIDLIREYRTRLVADVVTGKLDVRGVILPDDEPIEDDAALDLDELTDDADLDATGEITDAD